MVVLAQTSLGSMRSSGVGEPGDPDEKWVTGTRHLWSRATTQLPWREGVYTENIGTMDALKPHIQTGKETTDRSVLEHLEPMVEKLEKMSGVTPKLSR